MRVLLVLFFLFQNLNAATVKNPNGSFFNVSERISFLARTKNSVIKKIVKEMNLKSCSILNNPAGEELDLPYFYENKKEYRKLDLPIKKFQNYITEMAMNYLVSSNKIFVTCLVGTLKNWALNKAYSKFHYSDENRQAWYVMDWILSSVGMGYSIVRAEVEVADRRIIENWLLKLTRRIIKYKGGQVCCCNNHANWRGLATAIVGVVTLDDNLFEFGVKKYREAIEQLNDDGSFPLEMKRGYRAIYYQNFAILGLVYIAEVASGQGIDLYAYRGKNGDIHKAIEYFFKLFKDPDLVKKYTTEKQDLEVMEEGWNFNWLEPYYLRFGKIKKMPEGERLLKKFEPTYHRNTGGNATLIFRVH